MTREQEILSRAMNFVDDDLILAAHAPRKKLRHALPSLVAACLAVVIIATFPILREMLPFKEQSGDASAIPDAPADNVAGAPNNSPLFTPDDPDAPPPTVGDTVELGDSATVITMTALSDSSATLTVVKNDSTPLYIAFRQYAGGILATTQPGFSDNGVILHEGWIKLYINDATEPADMLPTTPGTYEVTVDFTSLRNSSYRIADIMYLYSYVGVEGAIEQRQFDIRLPEETADSTDGSLPAEDAETVPETQSDSDAGTESGDSPDTENQ